MKKRVGFPLLFMISVLLSGMVIAGLAVDQHYDRTRMVENNLCVYSGTGADVECYAFVPLDLRQVNDAHLQFWTMYTIVEPNMGYVQVSVDDEESWTVLESFSGFQYEWEQVRIDLDEYVGEQICLAFYFNGTDDVVDLGWYIDSVVVDAHWKCVYYNDFEQYDSSDAWWNFTVLEKPGPPPMILNQFFDSENNLYFFNSTITNNNDFMKSWDHVLYAQTVVPDENTYFFTHSYTENNVEVAITMWTTVVNGSVTPFNVYTLSSLYPYDFCEFACPMNSFCTVDDVTVNLQEELITADVHTTAASLWWGCFIVHGTDEITTVTALSETNEFELVEGVDFSVNPAGSVSLVAVQMKPGYTQVRLTFASTGENQAPYPPIISGPMNGSVNEKYTYTFSGNDPDGDDIQFFVDWGDGSHTGWTDVVQSGEDVLLNHSWNVKGSYSIKAKVKDTNGLESEWATQEIHMPKNKDQTGLLLNDFHPFNNMDMLGVLDGWWTYNESTKQWCILFPDIFVNASLVWSTEITDAYQAYFSYETSYDFGPYAAGFVELSKDDGQSWYMLDVLAGNATKTVREFDISHAAGNEILIRFRAKSGEDDLFSAGQWCIWNLSIYGMKDQIPPVSTVILNGNQTESGWYHSPVEVVISAFDPTGVGIKELHYIIDDTHYVIEEDSVQFMVSSTGEHTVEYWAVDVADNEETHHQVSFRIDLLSPDLSVDEFMPGVYLFGTKIFSAERIIFIGSFTITGMVADDESGVDTVQFFLDEILFAETTQSSFSVPCAKRHSGYAVLKIIASDTAGNQMSELRSFSYFMV